MKNYQMILSPDDDVTQLNYKKKKGMQIEQTTYKFGL